MDFEKQKPVTDEYREYWQRVFGASVFGVLNSADETLVFTHWKIEPKYPNGCPILNESEHA